MNLDESGRRREAADLLAVLADSEDRGHEEATWLEGMMRVDLGDYGRAVDLLERVVPAFEERYLLARRVHSPQPISGTPVYRALAKKPLRTSPSASRPSTGCTGSAPENA